ncbi:cupin domain-containing protein [Parvularcula sp. LCG005]|uniref:cupin domain-containing protein n=1 Tax=Parvularcula sp. LCG005 TaxID=3078805 RepID=UPI002943D24B|nr:cupin domain-containing protein [Parvularcula sp. LCG005]WOI53813.1 cupin domain-containing protein [Parvularcula sp. LCG005]
MTSASDIIAALDLAPHPEGGFYRETFRDSRQVDGRSVATAILFLLPRGVRSHWHRIDATEIWLFHAGAPLVLEIAESAQRLSVQIGADAMAGQTPQGVVPAGAWQSAQSTGDWTLVSCTVAPAFEFDHFEMAPKGWSPDRD